MRWITNLCSSADFAPWPEFDTAAETVLADLNGLLPETREFLDFYLPTSPYSDDALSTASTTSTSSLSDDSPPFSLPSVAPTRPLDSLEILLAALQTHPTHTVRRNKPVTSETGLQYRRPAGAPRRVCTHTPDLAVYAPGDAMTGLPIVTVGEVARHAPIFPDSTKTTSSRAVAATFADLFADERHADPSRRDLTVVRSVMRTVTKGVTQALLSQSGYAGLTNGAQAVLLKVERAEDYHTAEGAVDDDNMLRKRVVVRVSRAFEADGRKRGGPVHALVALIRLALQEMRKAGAERAGAVRDCVLRIGNSGNAETECLFEDRVKGNYDRLISRLGYAQKSKKADAEVTWIIRRHSGVVAVGATSVVLKGCTKRGVNVAVKYWNEVDVDGLRDLLDEMRIFRFLKERHPHVLGCAVPDLVLWRDEPKSDAALVTTFVGRGVFRDRRGRLCIGDGNECEVVQGRDEKGIIEAAKRSLRMLHDCGVAHGDVALRNLRIERRRQSIGMGRSTWHAWWVDLALAEEEVDSSNSYEFDMFRFERERVEKILVQCGV